MQFYLQIEIWDLNAAKRLECLQPTCNGNSMGNSIKSRGVNFLIIVVFNFLCSLLSFVAFKHQQCVIMEHLCSFQELHSHLCIYVLYYEHGRFIFFFCSFMITLILSILGALILLLFKREDQWEVTFALLSIDILIVELYMADTPSSLMAIYIF